MKIPLIQESENCLDTIREVWRTGNTFVLYPSRCAVSTEWLEQSAALLGRDYAAGHFCLLSSGSTGAPKLFVGSKSRAERLVRTLHEVQESEALEQVILALPLAYSYAFVNQFVWSECFGRRLIQTSGFKRPDEFGATLATARNAMLCLVGTQAKLLLHLFSGKRFDGVIRLHFAGGAFPAEDLNPLRDMFPAAAIFNNYGCIEAMPRLTVRRLGDEARPGEIGHPIPGVEMECTPEKQLRFRSHYQCVAQVEPNRLTPFAADAWLPTGDLAEFDEERGWRLAGRDAEVFKRHGEKISVPLILSTIRKTYRGDAAAYRETDSVGENAYVLVVAPSPEKTEMATLLKTFRDDFPRTHWPVRIESRFSLPVLPNGKIDNAALASLQGATTLWRQRI